MGGLEGDVGVYRAAGDDGPETEVDLGGGDVATADHYGAAGEDSPPLPEDTALLVPLEGDAESMGAAAYTDDTERKALKGEKRIYARDSDGTVVSEVHLKGDTSIEITQVGGSTVVIAADGSVTVTAGTINLKATDFVLLMDGADDFAVRGNDLITKINSLTFPTAMGPTGTAIVPAIPTDFNSTNVKLK